MARSIDLLMVVCGKILMLYIQFALALNQRNHDAFWPTLYRGFSKNVQFCGSAPSRLNQNVFSLVFFFEQECRVAHEKFNFIKEVSAL